jgi:hypothetical protein
MGPDGTRNAEPPGTRPHRRSVFTCRYVVLPAKRSYPGPACLANRRQAAPNPATRSHNERH